ncbi:CBN-PDCD-2 protein [Caenorhabditis brenneri]|uniref:CBN-PDCD-2 protein n=1 Tax=Caenorhabditis brenneri TaxID=135651 RepID=G0ME53_CAEBE|nr:CBN-PDCD-2 protein [Caenorhabditis brenneri]
MFQSLLNQFCVISFINEFSEEPVHLGFGVRLLTDDLYRLRSHYLPLGKVGGKPAWLNPKHLPKSADLLCSVCEKPMCFLMQVCANGGESDPPHAFHRTLFLFVCRNPECSRQNDASNLKAFRCQLPRTNDFYSFDGPADPEFGDIPDPYALADGPGLCRICGCAAAKKCAKCTVARYCSQAHQVIDWPTHKLECAKAAENGSIEEEPKNPLNPFVFKEFGIEIDQEYMPGGLFDGMSDDEDDNEEDGADVDDEPEEEKAARLKEFEKFVKENKGKNVDMTKDDLDAATAEQPKDLDFEKFNKLVHLHPDQIVRYKRFGLPLRATGQSELPEEIEPCELCGAPRRFEMQLMPHLLTLIDVDCIGQSIDWASVYVYTCSASCRIPDDGYAKEFVAKQDFV